MKAEWTETIHAMRDAGYLVLIWTPDELGDIDANHVGNLLIGLGNDMIELLKGDDE